MVELELKLNARQNVVRVPKLLTDTMRSRQFKIILDSQVAILCTSNATIADILPSLHLLIQRLELQAEREARAKKA